jgi:hypothetical protein
MVQLSKHTRLVLNQHHVIQVVIQSIMLPVTRQFGSGSIGLVPSLRLRIKNACKEGYASRGRAASSKSTIFSGGQHFSQNCNILICMPSCGHTLSINNPVHKHLHFRCFKTQDKIVQYTSIYAFDASKHKAKRDRKISLPGKR